jgi:hypothetical protein
MKKQNENNKTKGEKDDGTSLFPVLVNGRETIESNCPLLNLKMTNVWKRE